MKKKLITIIDDETDICLLLQEWLQGGEYQIRSFNAPAQALKDLLANAGDLIISDIDMPGISGLDIVTQLKENEIKTPIILMTGNAKESALAEELSSSIITLLKKPFDLNTLNKFVHQALNL